MRNLAAKVPEDIWHVSGKRWRSVKVTEFERRQMASVQKELDQEYKAMVGSQREALKG